MRAHFVPDGDSPESARLPSHESDALIGRMESLPPRATGARLFARVDAFSPDGEIACRAADEKPARYDGRELACPNHPPEQEALDQRVRAAARLDVDGVMLDTPDAWYAAGRDAGFCDACNDRLNAHLQREYGERFVPYPVVPRLAQAADAPFWREHAQVRLAMGLEHGARLARRVRDEARAARNVETWVGARMTGLNPAAVQLARKLDFVALPVDLDDTGAIDPAPWEVFDTALTHRPIVGVATAATAAQPGRALQAWRYATALGTHLALPEDAPAETVEALAQHRRFIREFASRYRPVERYAEVLLVYSPECDHWTEGRHGRGVRAAAEALTRICAQYRIVLGVPRVGSEPLVLVDAGALPHEEARHLQARVRDGATVVVVGRVGGVDESGRAFEPPLGELSEGLDKVGQGSVFGIDPHGEPATRAFEPLVVPLDRALDSLLGRGRRAAATHRDGLMVKLYLDPEKKLDVHLVGRHWNPATGGAEAVQGAVLRLSGSAVGGARTGWLFSPGAQERKVSLTPYDMGVQAKLPDFIGSAVLTVSR